jgi:hypothetical protein
MRSFLFALLAVAFISFMATDSFAQCGSGGCGGGGSVQFSSGCGGGGSFSARPMRAPQPSVAGVDPRTLADGSLVPVRVQKVAYRRSDGSVFYIIERGRYRR